MKQGFDIDSIAFALCRGRLFAENPAHPQFPGSPESEAEFTEGKSPPPHLHPKFFTETQKT